MSGLPAPEKWFDSIGERPAVQRGVQVLADMRKPLTSDNERETLLGKTQYVKR